MLQDARWIVRVVARGAVRDQMVGNMSWIFGSMDGNMEIVEIGIWPSLCIDQLPT